MSQADSAAAPQASPAGLTREPSEHFSLPGQTQRPSPSEEEALDAPEPVLPTEQPPLVGREAPVTPPALAKASGAAPRLSPQTPPLATILANETAESRKKLSLIARGKETASYVIHQVAEIARAKIEDKEAKSWTGLSLDSSLTAEQYWHKCDPEGKKKRLDEIVADISKEESRFTLQVASQRYEGQTLISRRSTIDIVSEQVISLFWELRHQLALAKPPGLIKLYEDFCKQARSPRKCLTNRVLRF